MNSDQLHDAIKAEIRKGKKPLEAFNLVFKEKAEIEYNAVTDQLFIYCEGMNASDVKIIDFLLFCIGYSWQIYSLARKPYIRVVK